MAERAAELAQTMTNCGADTWGGAGEFDKDILADNIGLNVSPTSQMFYDF